MAKTAVVGLTLLALLSGFVWLLTGSDDGGGDEGGSGNIERSAEDVGDGGATDVESSALETSRFKEPDEVIPELRSLDAADRDLDVAGRVVDEAGNPVAGAVVRTVRFPWRRVSVLNISGHRECVEVARTLSSHDGYFVLRHRRGALVDLRVNAHGFATKTVVQCLAGSLVTVTLTAATPFTIIAVNEAHEPVPDVAVRFWGWDRTHARAVIVDERRGTTDGEGAYSVRDLAACKGSVELEHKLFGSPGWQRIETVPGEDNVFQFVLPTGRDIRGRVTDAETGRPISGATVGSNWVIDRPVKTDADGWYVFAGWTGDGVHDLHALAEGYGRMDQTVGDDWRVDFAMQPGDTAVGRLISVDGKPVPGALVTAIASQSRRQTGRRRQQTDTRSTTSDQEGLLRLTSLRRDLPHTLVIQARGYGRYLLDFDPHAEGRGTIDLGDIRLPPARAIEGRVLASEDEPQTAATVTVTGWNADRSRLREGQDVAVRRYGSTESRRTDDLGRFRFPDLSPGDYKVVAERPGSPPIERNVQLPEDADILDLELRYDTGTSLQVKVRDDVGHWLEGITVGVSWAGLGREVFSKTDASGLATFDSVPSGTEIGVRPQVWNKPYVSSRRTTVTSGDAVTVITLVRAAVISGEVVDEGGLKLAGMQVKALMKGRRPVSAITDPDGTFSLKVEPGTTLDLEVSGLKFDPDGGRGEETGYRGRVRGVEAPATGVLVRATKAQGDRRLTVVVLDPSGRPASGAAVTVKSSATRKSGTTDEGGQVSIHGLLWETVTVSATITAPDEFVGPAPMQAVPDGQFITMRCRPAMAISGNVLYPEGAPVKDLNVFVQSGDDRFVARTDATGRFTARVASGLKYIVSAGRSDPSDPRSYLFGQVADIGAGEVTVRLVRAKR